MARVYYDPLQPALRPATRSPLLSGGSQWIGGGNAPAPVVTISGTPSVTEGGNLAFTLSANVAPASDITINLTYSGTATRNTDYTAPDTVTIASGATSASLVVTTINDAAVESSEAVVVTIAAGTGYTVGSPASSSGTIVDNDFAYDVVASHIGAAFSPYRLLSSYTGPLFTLTRLSDSATLDVTDADAQVDAFLAGRPGEVTTIYDQISGVAWTQNVTIRGIIKKTSGKWAFVSKGANMSMPTTNLANFNGVTGVAMGLVATNGYQVLSGEMFFFKLYTGDSASNSRFSFRTRAPLGIGLAGRKADGSSPGTESNSNASNATGGQLLYKPMTRLLGMLDYANGPLSVYVDGATTPPHLRSTYYTAGGTSSATTPTGSSLTVDYGVCIHEVVIYKTNLSATGALAAALNVHANYFAHAAMQEQPDGCWTYQNTPLFCRSGDYAVVGSVSREGRQLLTEINRATGDVQAVSKLGFTTSQDDHAPATFMVTPGGVAFSAWAGHNQAASIKFARGTTSRISSITSSGTVTTTGTSSYANCFSVGTKVCLLTRNLGTSPTWNWQLFVSTDDGVTFPTSYTIVGCPDQFYLNPVVLDADTVRFFGFKNSDAANNYIKLADLNLTTGDLTSGGVVIQNFVSTPAGTSDYDTQWVQILDPAALATAGQNRIYFWSANGTGTAVVFAISTSTGTAGELYYASLTSGTWSAYKVCDVYAPDSSITMLGRAHISYSPTTYPRVYVANSPAHLGASSSIERWDASSTTGSGTWAKAATLDTVAAVNNVKVCQPVTLRGTDGTGIDVAWKSGYFTEYYEYATAIKWA